MGFNVARRLSVLGVSLLTIAGAFGSLAVIGLMSAGPASASTSGCPDNPQPNTPVDNNVGAAYTTSGGVTTYTFSSFVNENSSGGIPGLIEYCVYTAPQPDSSAVDPSLNGADGASWVDPPTATFFAFQRPDGDPSNIPLDGTQNITMGTATWNSGTPPASQVILLHINDSSVCTNLGLAAPTCFVFPGTPQSNKDLTVSKTATPSFTRSYTWGITKNVDNTEIDIAEGGSATFNYSVSVTHDNGTDSGWQVAGQITVSNPNNTAFAGVDVTDSGGGGSCVVTGGGNATIPANNSADFPYTCTYSSNPGSVTDTATVTWDAGTYGAPDSQATATATADFSTVNPAIVDGSVSVTDTLGGTLGTVTLADPNPSTFTYSSTFTGDPAGTCTSHDNTATFTTSDTGTTGSASQSVTVCVGADLTVRKDATPSFTRTYTWGIAKSVDNPLIQVPDAASATANYTVTVTHDNGTDSNWQVTGTITVHNPNDWEPVTLTGVTDSIDNGGNCTVSGDTTQTIPASGDSAGLTYLCTYASAPSPLAGTNTATATWSSSAASTPDGSADGSATADFSKATPTIVDGSVIVTDTLGGTLGTVKYTDPSPTTFTYPITFSSDPAGTCTPHNNTATFVTSDTGTSGSASQSIAVCIGADLTVKKTATPSFIRTYNWKITKSAPKGPIVAGGTISYTVIAAETGFTDSGWQVTGTITVHNPNDWEPVALTGVTDFIDNGGTCTIFGNTTQTIPSSSDSTGLAYICSYTSAPSPSSGTNTATATWAKGPVFTPDGSASGTAVADFASISPTTVNKMITVTDSYAGTLGTATASDTQPFTTKTFTYTRKLTPPAGGCVTVNNTATIVETGQNATASVQDCNTGALTMGFWQNKNGHGIITGQASTGVCPSATWLRQYAPFQDLSSTATCSQVASYVTNIIKAANASGASMNPMLKAQMLATALDVYFGDPSLGGNKIGAIVPIGGVTIDLTHICQMIDSGGSGNCSNTLENVSSAFGGASSLTISQMLSYAASQSNLGGTTWYGNVKSVQQLAKDAFDVINNQVATSP